MWTSHHPQQRGSISSHTPALTQSPHLSPSPQPLPTTFLIFTLSPTPQPLLTPPRLHLPYLLTPFASHPSLSFPSSSSHLSPSSHPPRPLYPSPPSLNTPPSLFTLILSRLHLLTHSPHHLLPSPHLPPSLHAPSRPPLREPFHSSPVLISSCVDEGLCRVNYNALKT